VLSSLRVPLGDFAAQGVDLSQLAELELRFGGPGKPATGSIELADVRFQESVTGPTVARDAMAADVAAKIVEDATRAPAGSVPDVVRIAAPAPAPAARKAAVCPTAALTSTRLRGRRLTLAGSAGGCASAVKTVIVRLYKPAGSRCRFARIDGTLGRALPCSSPVGLAARGTSRWTLKLSRKLAKGTYKVDLRAIDAAGRQRATAAVKTLRVR